MDRRACASSLGEGVDVSADERPGLDPRSLAWPPFFEGTAASLFEVRRRLPTSATCRSPDGTQASGLSFPRREWGQNPLPFLTHLAPPLRVRRRAASRTWFALVGPATGSSADAVCPAAIPPRVDSKVRNKHGSEDRVKDAPSFASSLDDAIELHTLDVCGQSFPSSASSGHPLSSVRRQEGEETPAHDRPIEVRVVARSREGARRPEDQGAFHRGEHDEALAPVFASPLTPPTLFPQDGEKCFGWALQGPAENEFSKDLRRGSAFSPVRCALA